MSLVEGLRDKLIDLLKLLLASASTNPSGLDQTLAGGLVPQRHLHHFIHVRVGAANKLLVCSDPDLGILLGGAVQLQQHRSLEGRKPLSSADVRVTLTSSPQLIMNPLLMSRRKICCRNERINNLDGSIDSRQLSRENV